MATINVGQTPSQGALFPFPTSQPSPQRTATLEDQHILPESVSTRQGVGETALKELLPRMRQKEQQS